MNEHMGRYAETAAAFNKAGYIVAGADHRAHGLTAGGRANVGQATGDLYNEIVSDMLEITGRLHAEYGLPIILLGHSYGSFLSQTYFLKHKLPEYLKGVILSGSSLNSALTLILAGAVCALHRSNKPAHFIKKITFAAYDKKIESEDNAWLTHDAEIVKAYNHDAHIIDCFSYGFYKSFFKGLREMFKNVVAPPVGLPLFIASGAADGVGNYGKGVTALYKKYKALGFQNVRLKLYFNDRHEILNETDRETVAADMIAFADKNI
jgi:alpha-beta hydrolase superfamily lysophospholipase